MTETIEKVDPVRTPLNPDVQFAGNGATVFGPGVPLTPQDTQPARVWDFPVSTNTVITPRAYETSPKALRAYANVEIIRLCIETRKDQVEGLSWSIKPKGEKKAGAAKKKTAVAANQAGIDAMTKFWQKPDGVTDFATWIRASLEDLFVGDWPAWEMRRTFGGKLVGMDVIPGDTIHPLVDETGRRPRDRNDIAFQQVIKGRPWVNMTNADLLYKPRNPRPGHNYGMGPVEQIIVSINTFMRRQAGQLAYFTEGTTPSGFITGSDGWTVEQVAAYQAMLDDRLSGDQAAKAKMLVLPNGAKFESFKAAPLKDDFDEWLARVVCFAFNLPPTPFIKAMNKSTAETDKERAQAEGLQPIKLWWKRVADGVMEDEGQGGLEWSWDDDIDIDPALQSEMDDRDVKNGSRTLDEIRDRRGDEAYGPGVGDKPMIYTTGGAVLVEDAIIPPPPPPPPVIMGPNGVVSGSADPTGNTPPDPKNPPKGPKQAPGGTRAGKGKAASGHSGKSTASPLAKIAKSTAPIDVNRPVPRRAANGFAKTATAVLQAVGDDVAVHVARTLRALAKASDADTLAAHVALAAKIAEEADLGGLDGIIEDAFDDLFDVVVDSATAGLASVGAPSDESFVDKVSKRAEAYARQRSAELVSVDGDHNIVATTRAAIRKVIADGLQANIGTPAIATNIQAAQAFSPARAELIANTEVADANSAGVLEGFKLAAEHGIGLMKTWEINSDGDCCEDCQANADQGPIPLDETFQSGDDAPTAHPNCQCVLNSVFTDAAGDETEDDGE